MGGGAEVAGDPGSLSSAHTSRTEQEVTGAFLPHLFAEGVLKKQKVSFTRIRWKRLKTM